MKRIHAAAPPDDLGRAVTYMLIAAVLIPLLNASAKYLSAEYPVLEIVWARYAGHFLYMIIAFAPRRGFDLLVASRPVLQLLRSSLLCASTIIYMYALRTVSLPTAAAISFTGPFIVTVLAPLLLRERVSARSWIAVTIGFLGAFAIVRPGFGDTNAAAFLVFGSAAFVALYQILTRKLAAHDPAETSITYIALVGFVLTSIALPFVWKSPASPADALLFLGLGIFGGFGHYFMVRAFELAPAPFVSPFNYAQLIGAALLSFAVFGELPDLWTWVGASIIAGSGLYMLAAERRAKRPQDPRP